MEEESLGGKIKRLREARGWSQQNLSFRSGLSRSHIASIETRKNTHPRADYLAKLSQAFGVPLKEFYETVGYVSISRTAKHAETPEEILERLKSAQPVTVPVYTDFKIKAGDVYESPVEYVYLARQKAAKRHIEAYAVHNSYSTEPDIREGDIVLVDRDLMPKPGDAIFCLKDNQSFVCKFSKGRLQGNQAKYTPEDLQAIAVIIEVVRRLR